MTFIVWRVWLSSSIKKEELKYHAGDTSEKGKLGNQYKAVDKLPNRAGMWVAKLGLRHRQGAANDAYEV